MSCMENVKHLKIELEAIRLATNNFSDEYFLGCGGFGKVYKGELLHSKGKTWVALKRLDRTFGQGDFEFWKEINTLSLYAHENIVSLLGYCDDPDEKILVYEYASNKSLDQYLSSNDLTWIQRLKICVGAARGLAYLHNPAETQLKILHRDIKSSNILLDNNWNAKISDFGFVKFCPLNSQTTFQMSSIVGTPGYIDPMYHEKGQITEESDVYSFGVVLFEVLCGRFCYANNSAPLSGLVQDYYEQNKISDLVYSNIKGEIDESCLRDFVAIAYKCLAKKREQRPSMTQIVEVLQRSLDKQEKVYAKAKAKVIQRAGKLKVKVLGITEVSSEHPFDASNYYLVLHSANDTEWYTHVKGGLHEEFSLYVENMDTQLLQIYVYNIESVNKHRQWGWSHISLNDVNPDIPVTYTKTLFHDNQKYDTLKVEILYKPLSYANFQKFIEDVSNSVPKAPEGTPKDGGLLVIIIYQAHLDIDDEHINSSVVLRFRDRFHETPIMMNKKTPMWLQEFKFMLEKPPADETLHLDVFKHYTQFMGLFPKKESIGTLYLSLADVIKKKRTKKTYPLKQGYPVLAHMDHSLDVELLWRTWE